MLFWDWIDDHIKANRPAKGEALNKTDKIAAVIAFNTLLNTAGRETYRRPELLWCNKNAIGRNEKAECRRVAKAIREALEAP